MSSTKQKTPISWHFTCQLTGIFENVKEQYIRTIQSTRWLLERFRVWFLIWKRKWMTWLGSMRQFNKNWKQHHIQNKSKFLLWYLINGLKCVVENILMSLNTWLKSHEIKNVGGILVKLTPKKMKNYHHWNLSSSKKR